MYLLQNYAAWQGKLEKYFFSRPNHPVLIYVDEAELSNIYSDQANAVESLRSAILEYLDPARDNVPFEQVEKLVKRWKLGDRVQAPPVLPLLAMTVLAASRMEKSQDRGAGNYYDPLAELLLKDGYTDAFVTKLREKSSLLLVDFWELLHNWIESRGGTVGLSTIRTLPSRKRIGYALSQAMVKGSDRRILFQFFSDLDLSNRQIPHPQVLLDKLQKWDSPTRRFSSFFRKFLNSHSDQELLAEVVHQLAESWDGEQIATSVESRSTGCTAHLSINPYEEEIAWAIEISEDDPAQSLRMGNFILDLFKLLDPEWRLAQIPESYTVTSIMKGMALAVGKRGVVFRASPILFLRDDPVTGGLLTVEDPMSGEAYVLCCEQHLLRKIERFFGSYFHNRVEVLEIPSLKRQMGSAILVSIAGFKSEDELSRFRRAFNLGAQRSLSISKRPKMRGGLRLSTNLVSDLYLTGAEPDIVGIPVQDRESFSIEISGKPSTVSITSGVLRLREFGLQAGYHTVSVKGHFFEFKTSNREITDFGDKKSDSYRPNEADRLIRYAPVYLRETIEPEVLYASADETLFLIAGGNIRNVGRKSDPRFLSSALNGKYNPTFETWVAPDVVWIAQRDGHNWRIWRPRSNASEVFHVDSSVDLAYEWHAANRVKHPNRWTMVLGEGSSRVS
ncbi:hypothetical protein HMPREF0290_1245 [Corynebacterium efficiens YS-314]|nr:hypothetical protein [Corynebacterium efficiens]EEW50136.1 hypothetical protein HMPREF0290_1245 [Corynebacterium efficiens YS-314]